MRYRRLGRTGLNVSVLSFGSGGPNRLGQSRYVPQRQIRQLVHRALDLGINFFDTSSAYEQSEILLGAALKGVPRGGYYLASKVFPLHGGRILSAAEIRRKVDRSLQRLGVDELDILHLHRITPELYEPARDHVLPELEKLRGEGKFRYLGITESSTRDPHHTVLKRALRDNLFDTVMVGYRLANSSAAEQVFPEARARDVGIIVMASAGDLVYRNARERLGVLGRTLVGLAASPPAPGQFRARLRAAFSELARPRPHPHPQPSVPGLAGERSFPLPALRLPEATFTFAVSHPAVATVLTGTTHAGHLENNVAAVLAPPLSEEETDRLREWIGSPQGPPA